MSTVNRITGLATGLDVDQMVKDMLVAEQSKIDKVEQSKQLTTWKQEQYREIITEIKGVYDKYFDVLSPNYLMGTSSFNVTTIASSNSNVITATATSGAIVGDYNFEVHQKATSPSMASTVQLDKNTKLSDLGFTGETNFKINLGDKLTEKITIKEDDTVESIAKKINDASNGEVTATFSEMSGKFIIKSKATGISSELAIVDVDADGNDLGTSNALSSLGINGNKVTGQNAMITVKDADGNILRELNEEKNTFNIDGVTYNVNGVGTSELRGTTDTTKAVENMKKFIEEYNGILDKVRGITTEKKNADYPPLTEAQKKEMSETEIENWEKKAKSGILRGDQELRSLLNELSNAFGGALSEFGISGKTDYTKAGQLVLDEAKFTEALKTNGAKFEEEAKKSLSKVKDTLYKNVGTSSSVLIKKSGIANSSADAKNLFSEEITKREDEIKKLVKKMNEKETKLYTKFSKLESIMNKFNNQMSMFMTPQQ